MKDEKRKRRYGDGVVYEYRGRWIAEWWRDGKRYRKSAPDERGAQRLLRLMREAKPEELAPRTQRVTLKDLGDLLRDDYRLNGRRSLPKTAQALVHLTEFFGDCRARDITGAKLKAYVAERLAPKPPINGVVVPPPKPSTIQKELAALKRAFNLALAAGMVVSKPVFPTIRVSNVRTGFFEREDLDRVLDYLPPHLRPPTLFAYFTGWRKGEITALTWRQVDFVAGVVRLEPGTTKNRDGRTFPFDVDPELAALLLEQRERPPGAFNPDGPVFHRDGQPLRDFFTAWRTATKKAGVPGRLFHDLRRTAVRNLERAGVPRSWATALTGHKTESVFKRYAIVSEADLRDGVARLAANRPRTAPERAVGAGARDDDRL